MARLTLVEYGNWGCVPTLRARTESKIRDLTVCLGEAKSADARLFLSALLAEQLQILAGLDQDADESAAVEYGLSEAAA